LFALRGDSLNSFTGLLRQLEIQKIAKGREAFWFDPELYKKRSAVGRFFRWIEAFKKISLRYERYEHSFTGLIYLACSVMIGRILG